MAHTHSFRKRRSSPLKRLSRKRGEKFFSFKYREAEGERFLNRNVIYTGKLTKHKKYLLIKSFMDKFPGEIYEVET